MRQSPAIAALCVGSLLTGAAFAQERASRQALPSVETGRLGERPLLPLDRTEGLAVSRETYTSEAGSTAVRTGFVGSWSLTRSLDAGVGLVSVTRDARPHSELKRSWNAKDMGVKSDTVAAIAVRLRF